MSMETPKRPLKHAADGRRYSQWTTPTKFKHCDLTILFPTGYRWHSNETYKWVCPIRSCRNIFEFKQDLSDHTRTSHRNQELNDNLDGTASVVGSCLSDYPQMVSRGRPSRTAPPAVEPCLPSISPAALRASFSRSPNIDNPPSPTFRKTALPVGQEHLTSSSPIGIRLNAARRAHKERSVSTNVLEKCAPWPSDDQYGDDSAVVVDDDIEMSDIPRRDRSLTRQAAPTTPLRQKNNTPKPPSDPTVRFVTPNQSSERLLLRRLSTSGSEFGIEPESPSARRSARLHAKEKQKADLRSPRAVKKSVMTNKPNRKAARGLPPINTKRLGIETGPKSAMPSGPISARASLRSRTNSNTSANSNSSNRQLQIRTRTNDVEAEIDAYMGRSVSELIDDFTNTPKRTQTASLVRRDIHLSPNEAVRSTMFSETSHIAEFDVSNDDEGAYITPPSSQEHSQVGTALASPKEVSWATLRPSPEIVVEKWEVAPGTISSSPGQSGFIAYSGAYLSQPHAVPLSPGVGARVVRVQPGEHKRFENPEHELKKDMFCTVTCGKAYVKFTMPHTEDDKEFCVGRTGVITIARGGSCLVVNKWYEPLSLQIMEFAL